MNRRRRWTPEMDRTLLDAYKRSGIRGAADAVGATYGSASGRLHALGIRNEKRRLWTMQEDTSLRLWWGYYSLEIIAKRLKRGVHAVYKRAVATLKLRGGAPAGFETLTHAAERTGFETSSLRHLLRVEGVRAVTTMSPRRGSYARHMVEVADVDDAVERYMRRETMAQAAERVGLSVDSLRLRLRTLGVPFVSKRKLAFLPEDVDRAAALERLGTAAHRIGVHWTTLREWMRKAGIEHRANAYQSPDVYDRAASLARSRRAA
jgi:hypothetical protein